SATKRKSTDLTELLTTSYPTSTWSRVPFERAITPIARLLEPNLGSAQRPAICRMGVGISTRASAPRASVELTGGDKLMVSRPRRVAAHGRWPFTSKANDRLVVSEARAGK